MKQGKIHKIGNLKYNTHNSKGITLLALIITIIVILIIAAVMTGAIKNDGIINHAKNARDDYEQAQIRENETLQGYLNYLNNLDISGSGDDSGPGETPEEPEYPELPKDTTAPTMLSINASDVTWNGSVGTVTITAAAQDTESGILAYQFSTDDSLIASSNGWTTIEVVYETTQTIDVTTSGTYYFYVKDQEGNVNKNSITVSIGDAIKPEIDLTANPSDWTAEDVTLTGKSQDADSGLIAYAWTENATEPTNWEEINQTTEEITQTTTISSNGTRYFWTKDGTGNINVASIVVDKIDKTVPTMLSINASNVTWNGNVGTVTITARAQDTGSGIIAYQFSTNDSLTANSSGWTTIGETNETTQTTTTTATGTYYFYVKDQAGNINKNSVIVSIGDTILPEINLTASTTAWTTGNVTLTGKSQDAESGLIGYAWTEDAEEPTNWETIAQTTSEITQTTTLSSNGTRYFWTKDGTGNINVASIVVDKIDKSVPTMVSITVSEAWNEDTGRATITARAQDTGSGIIAYQFSTNNSLTANSSGWTTIGATNDTTQNSNVTSTGTHYFYVKDQAGNINKNSVTVTVSNKVETEEITTENSTINGEAYSATNPVIPAGFKAINTETSSWDAASGPEVTKGLVISDGTSEFVWIPVADINEMAKVTSGTDANGRTNYQGVLYNFSGTTATEKTNYGQSTTMYREPANLTNTSYADKASRFSTITWTENLYQESFNKMVESVKKYKGFYVGRYETSLNGTVAQSKSGATPMNTLNWWKHYENSLTFSASNTSLGVESEMIWGCQWDAMLRFILTGSEASHVTATTNVAHNLSSSYLTGGTNYTGSVTYNDKASNIYDLEGNVFEWTQEAINTHVRINRGAIYNSSSSPSNRIDYNPTYTDSRFGSRLALYVKV